jgi:hypothetical protein
LGAYRATLHAFIHEANAEARARLLRTDLMPLLRILKRKTDGSNWDGTTKTILAFTGMSFEALLEGIWRALEEFAKKCGQQSMAEQLAGIHVELIRFDHDLAADEEEGIGADRSGAKTLAGLPRRSG